MNCAVCGEGRGEVLCIDCTQVREMVIAMGHEYTSLVLVVDGSQDQFTKRAGAGLVLARECDEVVIATCAAAFTAKNSVVAEYQAIRRGLLWAPVRYVWSDCTSAVGKAQKNRVDARFIPDELRDPLHNLAHRLAYCGRQRDWERRERLWIPGEVW